MNNSKISKNGKAISTPQEIFERHVQRGDGCWNWGGYLMKKNYGFTRIGGRGSKGVLAHRLSWMLHFGEIPDGLHVCHKCDNPSCVRPDHLFLGTNQDNILDRVAKKRSSTHLKKLTRDEYPSTKVKTHQLLEMVNLYKSGVEIESISKSLNIAPLYAQQLIYRIKNGKVKGVSWS